MKDERTMAARPEEREEKGKRRTRVDGDDRERIPPEPPESPSSHSPTRGTVRESRIHRVLEEDGSRTVNGTRPGEEARGDSGSLRRAPRALLSRKRGSTNFATASSRGSPFFLPARGGRDERESIVAGRLHRMPVNRGVRSRETATVVARNPRSIIFILFPCSRSMPLPPRSARLDAQPGSPRSRGNDENETSRGYGPIDPLDERSSPVTVRESILDERSRRMDSARRSLDRAPTIILSTGEEKMVARFDERELYKEGRKSQAFHERETERGVATKRKLLSTRNRSFEA
ncbi:uncharacterized protein LOC143152339 [Ptiloglossa arizonensis]|uniref:uncharacterized protein LOC143152339 n=1 Tax=Ptiloglossa arizonensis TaxID=3350558 RepID=UPI003FA00EB7